MKDFYINMTKSAASFGFGPIYWKIPNRKVMKKKEYKILF